MNIVKAILALAAFVAVALPSVALSKQQCDDCETLKKGVSRQVIPTSDKVCIYFVQPRRDSVLLRLDLQNGETRKYTKRMAGTSGRFCIGRHWVRRAETMLVCNSVDGHTDYPQSDVHLIAAKPEFDENPGKACLFGKKKCAEMGYKTQ